MNRLFLNTVLLIVTNIIIAQQNGENDLESELLYKFETDSIPQSGIRLKEVVLFQPLKFKTINDLKDYVLLRNRTLRVYPYAKLASDRLDTLSIRLKEIKRKRSKKIYMKRVEKFIYSEFEQELRKLSRSQGRILIKLVHRQTGETTHSPVSYTHLPLPTICSV